MRGLRTILLILLAAVFAVGGPLRALPCQAKTVPPCHAMADDMTGAMADMPGMAHDKAPAHKPRSDALAMTCCAGCLPASARDLAPLAAPREATRLAFAPVLQVFDGQSPAPDHDPPRVTA